MVSQASRCQVISRRAFTLTELLVAMALIVFIMSIISQSFVDGLETFRRLKGAGDLSERLRGAAVALREEILAANVRAEEFIITGLRTNVIDLKEAAELRADYEAIRDDAAELEPPLRDVERQTTNPVARRLIRRIIADLDDIKTAAARQILILELVETTDFPPPSD